VIGNAVPPPLAKAIGTEVLRALNRRDTRWESFDDVPS
jgi:site-specific DNA-cytosine methylase